MHNPIADTISWLEYDPSVNQTAESYYMTKVKNSKCNQRQNWMAVSKHWCNLEIDTNKHEDLNFVFAAHGEEDEMYPLAETQHKDQELKVYFKKKCNATKRGYIYFHLIEDTKVLLQEFCKLIIPASLSHRAVSWYHHYLQHPGHSRLKEKMRSVMYWKGMCIIIQKYVKSCQSCQINKRHSLKYEYVPSKLFIMTPWRALCIDLVSPYTLKSKDGSSIDFMCLTMIDPATSWFKIVELPTITKLTVPNTGKGKKATCTDYTKVAETFNKTPA